MAVAYSKQTANGEEELRAEYRQFGKGKGKVKKLDVRFWHSNASAGGELRPTPKGFTVPDDEEHTMALLCALAETVAERLRIPKTEMLKRIDLYMRDWQGMCSPPPEK